MVNKPKYTPPANADMLQVPPHDYQLEAGVIGAMLLEGECQDLAFAVIRNPGAFYKHEHREVFTAMQQMNGNRIAIDLMTVTDYMRKLGTLDAIGGGYFLTCLTMSVLSSAHVETHARLVQEKYLAREIIRVCNSAIANAYADIVDVFDQIDSLSNGVIALTGEVAGNVARNAGNVAIEVIADMQKDVTAGKSISGVDTGITALNEKTRGWQAPNVIILAARPSVGKSSFANHLALQAAKQKKAVAIFSLEMSANELVTRMLSSISGVEIQRILDPKCLNTLEWSKVEAAKVQLNTYKILIDDTAGLNAVQLRAKARGLKMKHDVQFILIDYLQLMEGTGEKGMSREQVVSRNSREIKKLAKDLNVPIIALSQLNRGTEADKRPPQLSDLRESGAIEQDADIVMFLSDPNDQSGNILITMAKGRSIGLGIFPVAFDKSRQKWGDVVTFPEQQQQHVADNPQAGFSRVFVPGGFQPQSHKVDFDNLPNY